MESRGGDCISFLSIYPASLPRSSTAPESLPQPEESSPENSRKSKIRQGWRSSHSAGHKGVAGRSHLKISVGLPRFKQLLTLARRSPWWGSSFRGAGVTAPAGESQLWYDRLVITHQPDGISFQTAGSAMNRFIEQVYSAGFVSQHFQKENIVDATEDLRTV